MFCKKKFFILIFIQIATQKIYSQIDLVLPTLVGCAVSEFQNSGRQMYQNINPNAASNWSVHECLLASTPSHPLRTHGLSANGTRLWQDIHSHITMLKQLGANALRFSVEWAMIEPEPGKFCQDALDHYAVQIDALLAAGITPMITLHHFTHPLWFEQKGGWTNEENIEYFVRFAKVVFNEFQDRVKLWISINEIAPFAFQGYCSGVFPPGIKNPWLAAKVMRNMLLAHCQVYKTLKEADKHKDAQIGFNHNYLHFEAADKSTFGCLNFIEKVPTNLLNYVFNDAVLHFLKTGVLFPYNPFLKLVVDDIANCFDFIGLNFYSRVMIKSDLYNAVCEVDPAIALFPTCASGELMTDMPFPVSPEAFFDAILAMASFGVPLYITENGCPDANDAFRPEYIKSHLEQLSKAMLEGINIKAYFYWTLVDNFEWNYGYTQKFGLYAYDKKSNMYLLKNSGNVFKDILAQAERI